MPQEVQRMGSKRARPVPDSSFDLQGVCSGEFEREGLMVLPQVVPQRR